MNTPLVSVIVTVYNGENYLRQSIESVIQQSYKNIEVIIVDDGSTDKTAELAKSYSQKSNIHYVLKENGGHASALNKGATLAKGDFLSFIDHDDLWEPTKLDIQVSAFIHDVELDVVFAHQRSFAENEAAEKLTFEKEPVPGYMPGPMLIRTNAFLKMGAFNTKIEKGYFLPWFDLLRINGLKKLLLPDLLYHRRVHGGNLSICSNAEDYKDYFSAIREIRKQNEN